MGLEAREMPKPEWLVENEKKKSQVKLDPTMCFDCQHLGEVVGHTRHKGQERVEVFECAMHPGCKNTKYSICCDDYSKRA